MCSSDLSAELTTTTFTLAVARQPPPPGLLHHSDWSVFDFADRAFTDERNSHVRTKE